MGLRPAFAVSFLLTAGLALVGCGGGAPLAEAERHLAAGRLERASALLDTHSGPAVDALRGRIDARVTERAQALARIDELQRSRDGRAPSEVLEDFRALVAEARDPFVREHAEVALSAAYDWAAEQRSTGALAAADRRAAGGRAGASRSSDAGRAAPGQPGAITPTDPLAAAALREFERHVLGKDWRSALGLAERWSDGVGVDTPVRAAFDTWRSAALAEATREADALVIRAWRLDEAGDRAAAVALLSAAVDRFPAGDEVALGSPVGGVARALAELSGFASTDRSTQRGTDEDARVAGVTPDDAEGQAPPGAGATPGQVGAEPSTDGSSATSPVDDAEVAAAGGATRDGDGRARRPRQGAGDGPSAAGAAPTGPPAGGATTQGDGPGLAGGALTGGALGGSGRGLDGSPGPPGLGPDPQALARARLEELSEALVQARSTAERDAAFATLYAATRASSPGREVLAEALEARFQRVVVRLDRSGSLRRIEKVAEQRRALDLARERALALIFDEVRYFYPYSGPDVSQERAASYPAVQREVDDLVAEVREVWSANPNARIPETLRAELPELAWLRRRQPLVPTGLVLPEKFPAWLEALPHDLEEVDLRSFAWRVDEARDLARNRAIEARNEQLWAKLDSERASGEHVPTAAEREQVRVTNEYRAMMGRRALAWHPALNSAARGHSVYMDRTGHFGHHEATADRHSPFDRMRLVGYTRGVSENCHMGSTDAEGAHRGWLGSSGHHRNLLMAGHREMASAIAGSYWTQNFGLDTSFEQHLDLRGWRD